MTKEPLFIISEDELIKHSKLCTAYGMSEDPRKMREINRDIVDLETEIRSTPIIYRGTITGGSKGALDGLYPQNTIINENGDLDGGWEINPKALIRLKKFIQSQPSFEFEADLEEIQTVILAIKHELKYGKAEPRQQCITTVQQHKTNWL